MNASNIMILKKYKRYSEIVPKIVIFLNSQKIDIINKTPPIVKPTIVIIFSRK